MFNRILLPLDRSPLAESVLPHAIALARAFESQLTLLHVMDTARGSRWRRAVDPLNWQIRKVEAESYLHDLTLRLQQAGITPETRILEGHDAEQIIEFARNDHTELIILSSHGQSGMSEWNVSNVVQKIALRARTCIMIVRASQRATPDLARLHYRRILVPVDGSQRAECILPVAATLARAHEAQILLAHIVQPPQMPRRTPPSREDVELANRIVERNTAEVTQYLEQLRSQLSGQVEPRVLVSDHVSATLHELVEQEQSDLVLLSAHGFASRTRWLYGDVVTSFISYGTTPLLIMQDVSPERIGSTQAETTAEYARA